MPCFRKIKTDELLIGLQNKSEAAFSVLYDQYSATLWNIVLKMARYDEAAKEILHDVFVKIWRNIHQYDAEKETLFTWMLNITRNTCQDYFRNRNYLNFMLKASLTDLQSHNPIAISEKQEHCPNWLLATQLLEARHKIMIELVYINGYTLEEVAEHLQISVGAVKTRSIEAVRQLRYIYLTCSTSGECAICSATTVTP